MTEGETKPKKPSKPPEPIAEAGRRVGLWGPGIVMLTKRRAKLLVKGAEVAVEHSNGYHLATIVTFEDDWALADAGKTYYVLELKDHGWEIATTFDKADYERWEKTRKEPACA